MSVAERVKKIIAQHLAVAPERITDDALLMDHLDADSLDVSELIIAFEEEFAVDIKDQEADTVKTVGDAVKAVERCIENKEKK